MNRVNPPTARQIDDIFKKFGIEGNEVMTVEFQLIPVDQLKPHPKNVLIYGQDEDVTDLKDQIIAYGKILDPLKVTENYVIISGHRRWKAATELGISTVPCEFVKFDTAEEELAALVLYNSKRNKTNEQKTREGITLAETLSIEAVQRRLANLNQHRTDMAESATSGTDDNIGDSDVASTDASDRGLTRDKVAKAVGLKSGRAFDLMREILTNADKLASDGNTVDAELLVAVLNRSPSAAKDLLKVPLESLSSEDRANILTGKVKPRRLLSDSKPTRVPKKKTPVQQSDEYIEILRDTTKLLKDSMNAIEDAGDLLDTNHELDPVIECLRDLRAESFYGNYEFFKDVSYECANMVSEITKSMPDVLLELNVYGLEMFKEDVEAHIEDLQELLKAINSGIESKEEQLSKTESKKPKDRKKKPETTGDV